MTLASPASDTLEETSQQSGSEPSPNESAVPGLAEVAPPVIHRSFPKPLPKPPQPIFPLGLFSLAVLASVGLHIGLLRIAIPERTWDVEEPELNEILIPITATPLPTPSPTPEPSPTPTPTPTPEPSPTPSPTPTPEPDESPNLSLSGANIPQVPSNDEQTDQGTDTPPGSGDVDPPLPVMPQGFTPDVNLAEGYDNAVAGCLNSDSSNCATVPGMGNVRQVARQYRDLYRGKNYQVSDDPDYDENGVIIYEMTSPDGSALRLAAINNVAENQIVVGVVEGQVVIERLEHLQAYYEQL